MESDRAATLAVEAAVTGVIDFRRSRILDPHWWRHFRVMTAAIERRSRSQVLDASFRYHLALVANGSLTEESFGNSQAEAKERYYDFLGSLRPWEGKSYVDRRAREFKDSRQQYIDSFGADPLDPAFKEWEAEQIRRIDAGEFDVADPEADAEAEMTRRLQERIEQKKAGKQQR